MSRKIFMLGGFDILCGRVSPLDRLWISEAAQGPILIIDITCRSRALQSMYSTAMRIYFARLTKKKPIFVSRLRSRDSVVAAFESAGAIYIPGGDTAYLLDELTKRDLGPLFQSVTGPIVGNSAGAVAVCKEAVLTTDAMVKKPSVRPGLGLVDFSIDPHYNERHDKELFAMSHERVIYGVPETSAVMFIDGKTEFNGPVWRFNNSKKTSMQGISQ